MIRERGLAKGTILYDAYEIREILGQGGFGITYRAIKQSTGESVAMKEYFPVSLATRQQESGALTISQSDLSEYTHGKERFMREAFILKEYQYLQGIVKVWDCFEQNNTAYIVMEYIEGVTLKEYIASHDRMNYTEFIELMTPVFKSLIALHRHGVIHRDISPDNLMIGLNNQLYLIDFGSAKEIEPGKTATVLLKAGYAPPEQYLHDGDLGAWTDVYAICATMYMALCGKSPTDAVARLQGKELLPLGEYDVEIEQWQWDAIAKGMSVRVAQRYRSVEDLYDALTIEPSSEDVQTIVGEDVDLSIQRKLYELNEKEQAVAVPDKGRKRWFGVMAVLLLLAIGAIYFGDGLLVGREALQQQEETDNMTEEEKEEAEKEEADNATLKKQENGTFEENDVTLCSMPDVVGQSELIAQRRITAIDKRIVVRVERLYSDEVAIGVVMEQSVKPNTQYNEGSIREIILTVSKGAEPKVQSTVSKGTEPTVQSTERNSDKKAKEKEDDYFDIESEEETMPEFYFE